MIGKVCRIVTACCRTGWCGRIAGARQQSEDRRAARAARDAGCADPRGASSLPPAVSERPPRCREEPRALVVRPAAARLTAAASPVGCALSTSLVAGGIAVARHLAVAG